MTVVSTYALHCVELQWGFAQLKGVNCPDLTPPLLCRVSTALVLLTVSPPPPLSSSIMVLPVVIMICREVTMSALREWAASAGGGAHKVRVCYMHGPNKVLRLHTWSPLTVACHSVRTGNSSIAEGLKGMAAPWCRLLHRTSLL